PNTGWTYDGPRFWVFDGPLAQSDVVAVQQYHATNPDGGWNILYRLEGDPPPEGWVHDGVAFYGYATPGADRSPIYEHSAPTTGGVPRVVYTESEQLGLGWTLERISFYAPNPPDTLNEV
ncbi:MAG: hypothetical protein GX868_05510, partial [Actinobacteria bacterium]|nr:hypothetical protein [Actinomycetota bacterium]